MPGEGRGLPPGETGECTLRRHVSDIPEPFGHTLLCFLKDRDASKH